MNGCAYRMPNISHKESPMLKKIEEFEAVDSNNKSYRVIHFKSIINAGTLDDPGATILGLSEFRLSTGENINRISDTEFELLHPQIRIFRK
jgi:hypothetical protein